METPDLKRILKELGVPTDRIAKLSLMGEAIIDVAWKSGLSDADSRLLLKALGKLLDAAPPVLAVDAALTAVISDEQLARMKCKGRPC